MATQQRLEVFQPRPSRHRGRYPRWRATCLSLVYLLFAVHIVHWKVSGTTLAPLELNEVMYTLELGIITAGFLFMCLLVLGTLIFGRFFCSWACHIMVLQDFCAWLLAKVGIKAKPIRSRLLLFVPPLTATYMFLWPQIARMWESRSFPTFHFATDRDGWASLVTDNFWRNLPGPAVIAVTFLVCGFFIVYLLGSRSFCTYVCPYGAIFGLADRFSPGRILVNDSCRQCGRCTAVCKTGVRVHEEVNSHGKVVNPACLKCLDCVSVCPQGALSFGFRKPALFQSYTGLGRFGLPYEFSVREEILAAAVCALALFSFRGLYGQVPFLLSLAIGCVLGYLAVTCSRLLTRPALRLANLRLKQAGRWTWAGGASALAFVVLGAFLLHSGFVRWHEYQGLSRAFALRTAAPDERPIIAAHAYRHLLAAKRWGLLNNGHVERTLVHTALELPDLDKTAQMALSYLAIQPGDDRIRLAFAKVLMRQGRREQAQLELERVIALGRDAPQDVVAGAHDELASMASRENDFAKAAAHFRESLNLFPDRAAVHADFGGVLAELGDFHGAIEHLRRALQIDSKLANANYNLGTLLAHTGRFEEAIPCYEQALASNPDDADLLNNLGSALLRTMRFGEAEPHLRRAIERVPDHADAHFNLAVVLDAAHRSAEAAAHLQTAARLDARYAALMQGDLHSE